ncbi:hypothetical protein L208DRAFT_853050 [Tricholoma matsutake]|nr:hypothetical protein L208DRAFT_853050 [Tricholoma matsutake 945]
MRLVWPRMLNLFMPVSLVLFFFIAGQFEVFSLIGLNAPFFFLSSNISFFVFSPPNVSLYQQRRVMEFPQICHVHQRVIKVPFTCCPSPYRSCSYMKLRIYC